ncbi:MAG: hypothetical protein HAW63_05565 [Bdellovibrionaceae bacterium]|nr:hypothetical protein [Pseudobdellovibrionaceae bacterium]
MIYRIFSYWLCCVSVYYLETSAQAKPQIFIHVGSAKIKVSTLAVPQFRFVSKSNRLKKRAIVLKTKLHTAIAHNLKYSSFLQVLSSAAFLENSNLLDSKPYPYSKSGFRFKKWSQIGANFLIRGDVFFKKNKFVFQVFVYNVNKAKQLFAKEYSLTYAREIELLADTFSNDLVYNITGKPGVYLSKVVASYRSPSRYKEIYTMDWDGKNKKRITFHRNLAISPSWSWNKKKLLYTAFPFHVKARQRNPDLFIYDIKTKKRKILSYFKGVNSGGVFVPGDERVILSRTNSRGGSYLVEIFAKNGKLKRYLLGKSSTSLNVEPAVSPDGKWLAYSSNKVGREMLYVMNLKNKKSKRLTFAGRYNSSPSWSPDSKTIVFAGYSKGHYDIFSISKDGNKLKRLTSIRAKGGRWANNEDPSFSPDGQMVVFSSDKTGFKHLYIMRASDGGGLRAITSGAGSYERPKWSR